MKTTTPCLLTKIALLLASLSFNCTATAAAVLAVSDPYVDSWLTSYSRQYARIYTNDAAKAAGNYATTWSNGTQTQSSPAYAGVQEIYSSSNWLYLRTSG